jgi:hypothetical protein
MRRKITGLLALLAASTAAQAVVIDFDDNYLAPDSVYSPAAITTWSSGGATFNHGWNDTFNCCWDGATYSNKADTTTSGFTNDQSAITGDGVGAGQDNYAVLTPGSTGDAAVMSFTGAKTVQGAYFTNTTYAYLAMAYGDDGNSPAFVKGPFGEDDWLKLLVTGLDSGGGSLGTLEFLLADGADILDDWTWFDLSGLGQVHGLSFTMDSTDKNDYGLITPAYFAMDSMSVVPVPSAVWLFVSGLGFLGLRRRKQA